MNCRGYLERGRRCGRGVGESALGRINNLTVGMSNVAVGFLVGERLDWMASVYFRRLDCRLLAGSQGVGGMWAWSKSPSQMSTYTFCTLTPYGACACAGPALPWIQIEPLTSRLGSKISRWEV